MAYLTIHASIIYMWWCVVCVSLMVGVEVEGTNYLRADMSLICNDDTWNRYVGNRFLFLFLFQCHLHTSTNAYMDECEYNV
jgi:hypothetical protein